MFLEVHTTLFDPLNRNLDLREVMPIYLHAGVYPTEWKVSTVSCIYMACGEYFVMREMKKLGLKYITKDGVFHDPEPTLKDLDLLSLAMFHALAAKNGAKLREIDMLTPEEQKEVRARYDRDRYF